MTKDQVKQWFNDAVADGWEVSPFMQGESIEYSAALKKGPFKAFIFRRPDGFLPGFKEQYEINLWNTWSGLAIHPPATYDYNALFGLSNKCIFCEKPWTKRLAFASAVCDDCYEENKARIEPEGWER